MDINIVSYDLIDYNNISIEKPIENKNLYTSKILYNDKSFCIKSPKMLLKNIIMDNNTISAIEVEFISENNNFYQFFFTYRIALIDNIYNNSERLLGSKLPEKNVENLMRNIIQLPKTLKNFPHIHLKTDNLVVVNNSNTVIDNNSLQEDTLIEFVFSLNTLNFYTNKITIDVKTNSIKNNDHIPQISSYDFDNSDTSITELSD